MKRCGFTAIILISYLLATLQLQGARGAVVVNLLQSNYTVDESSGVSVCVRVTGNFGSSIDLYFHAVDGTATEGVDYTLNGNHTLQPPPGGGAPTDEHCLPVFQLCQDDVPEDDETLTVAISSTNPLVSLLQNNFTVTIIDDDRVEVSFTRERYTVAEGGSVEVCAETSGTSDRAFIPLTINTTPGTAGYADFFVSGVRLNTQQDGDESYFQKCMILSAIDDNFPEEKEFFRISLSSSDSLVDFERDTVRIYITDNDPVTFSLEMSVYEVEEGETARVCLVAGSHDLPLIRFHLLIQDLGGNATGQDYAVHNDQYFVVGIGSYTESSEICVDVVTTDDDLSEGTETQSLGLQLSTNVAWVILSIPHDTTAEVIILDNDVVSVEFEESSYVKSEGSFPYISVCVGISGRASQQPHLTLSTRSGTAVGGEDYEASEHQFELPGSRYCHQLRIFDDNRPETEETFNVCVTSESPLIHITAECVPIHVVDNDVPELVWEREEYSVSESEGEIEVCVHLVGTLRDEIEVHLTTTDITAIGHYDYSSETQTVSIGPTSEPRQCRHIDILSDHLVEYTEMFRVSLTLAGDSGPLVNISHPHAPVHIQDSTIGSECVEGEVLLNRGYGGRNLSLVEWCNDRGKWESVCDTEWSREDAETVCRQAGFNRVLERVGLASLETAAATFTCTHTEPRLSRCLGEQPGNLTCQHLLLACAEDDTTAPTSPSAGTGVPSVGTPPAKVEQSEPDSAQFPVVGVVVGVVSALLLVGVVVVVGVVSGALLWRRKKSESLTIASEGSVEAPVYEALQDRAGTSTPSPTSSSSNSNSCRTSSELYSEIPPLAAPSGGPLPSFYDVIRPHGDDGNNRDDAESSVTGDLGEGVREGEKGDDNQDTQAKSVKSGPGNQYEMTRPTSSGAGVNLYETVSDPFSSLEGSGEYSTLERRGGYATLEPYTGGGTLIMKQLGREQEEANGGGQEEEQYAHLHH